MRVWWSVHLDHSEKRKPKKKRGQIILVLYKRKCVFYEELTNVHLGKKRERKDLIKHESSHAKLSGGDKWLASHAYMPMVVIFWPQLRGSKKHINLLVIMSVAGATRLGSG